jgi:hypothetical protein
VQANAKIDYFGPQGRGRGDLWLFASSPARLRFDLISPFGVNLATFASDGAHFSVADLAGHHFYKGAATACAIGRFTQVPIPGHALVSLLRGQAPILKHDAATAQAAESVRWDRHGYYVATISGANQTEEELHLEPEPSDVDKPWSEQRLRVRAVIIREKGEVLYQAELDDFSSAPMAEARVDPDGIDPPTPPSGPKCTDELPRKIHVQVPLQGQDVQFRYEKVTWNPPLPDGTFVQPMPGGMQVIPVSCAPGE